MHVLDNAVWHALVGPQSTVAQHVPLAARYLPDVSVFAALPDERTAESWADLRELVGPGGGAFLARADLKSTGETSDGPGIPESWTVQLEIPCRQMWLNGPLADAPVSSEPIVALGSDDVPEMLDLVQRTEPGPFLDRTIELGTYLGIRDDGNRLIAMAGERLHPPGFTEISAVCTDSAHRGRGLAAQLVGEIVRGIRSRGETPFLHLTLRNEPAHRVYSALGFETRVILDVIGLGAPD